MFDSNDLHPKNPFGQYTFTDLGDTTAVCDTSLLPEFCNKATTRDRIVSAPQIPIIDALGLVAPCSLQLAAICRAELDCCTMCGQMSIMSGHPGTRQGRAGRLQRLAGSVVLQCRAGSHGLTV